MLNVNRVNFEEMISWIRENKRPGECYKIHVYISMYLCDRFQGEELFTSDVEKCVEILQGMDVLTEYHDII